MTSTPRKNKQKNWWVQRGKWWHGLEKNPKDRNGGKHKLWFRNVVWRHLRTRWLAKVSQIRHFSLKKKTKTEHHHPHHSLLCFCCLGFFKKNSFSQKSDKHHSFKWACSTWKQSQVLSNHLGKQVIQQKSHYARVFQIRSSTPCDPIQSLLKVTEFF